MSKNYYNQPIYSEDNSIHKPNEISSSDTLPPPPYSPAASSSRQYGRDSVDQPQEQVGLLGQTRDIKSNHRTNPHLDAMDEGSSASRHDPGCCRKWCKFIFLAILLSLVIYKFSDKLSPSSSVCANGVSWQSMPSIDFSQNIEFIMEGSVTRGHVSVVPLDDRHGGLVQSDIQVSPSQLQDAMSYSIEHPDDDTTRITVKLPPSLQQDDCVSAHIEIRMPYAADHVRINVQNVDVSVHPFIKSVKTVDIKTSNGDLVVDHWTGETAQFTTTHGKLETGMLQAKEHVYLENEDGDITVTGKMTAKDTVTVKTDNGAINLLGSVEADNAINIQSSNGVIQVAFLLADRVFVQNGNGEIQLDGVQAKEQVTVQSSNAPMEVTVLGEKNNRVAIMNGNADIRLHMTHEFEGRFVISTSYGSVEIKDEEEDAIDYQDDLDTLKRGTRRGYGNKGDLTVQTSNANVDVSFDV